MDWRDRHFGGLRDKDRGFWQPPAKWLSRIKEIADDGGRNHFWCVVIFSVTLRLLYLWGQNRLYWLNCGVGGHQNQSGCFTREEYAFIDGMDAKREETWRVFGFEYWTMALTKMKYQHQSTDACFKATAAMWMRSEIFWHVPQNRLVISYRHCGKKPSVLSSRFLDCLNLEYRTDRLSRNVGTELPWHPRTAQTSTYSRNHRNQELWKERFRKRPCNLPGSSSYSRRWPRTAYFSPESDPDCGVCLFVWVRLCVVCACEVCGWVCACVCGCVCDTSLVRADGYFLFVITLN